MLGENSGKIKKSKKGFTLIEILVVIFVLGIGLIGALSFFNININNQFEAKNELIAAGLAQEGADLVRNLRDYRTLNETSWQELTGQAPYTLSVNRLTKCTRIDYRSISSAPRDCNNGGGSDICFSGGRYYQCAVGTTGMGMQRTLTITPNASGDGGLAVECDVTWNGRTTKAKDVIYGNSY